MKSRKNCLIGFGDSIMKGIVVRRNEENRFKFSLIDNSLTDRLGAELSVDVKNFGKMGCTIQSGEKILDSHLSELSAGDVVLLEYGGCDSNYSWGDIANSPTDLHRPVTPLSEFSDTYRSILKKVMYAGAVPVVLSLPPIDADRYFEYISSSMTASQRENVRSWLNGSINNINYGHELYNLETIKVAHQMLVPWIDITSAFLTSRNYRDYLCADGLHPNELGQKLIADAVSRKLRYAIANAA